MNQIEIIKEKLRIRASLINKPNVDQKVLGAEILKLASELRENLKR